MDLSRKEQARRVARLFDATRARRNIVGIWEKARWMDTPAIYKGVNAAAGMLREAGLKDVQILDVPGDGKTTAGGWIMPVAWEVRSAKLEAAGRGAKPVVLADYAANPQNVAFLSPGTPGGKWVSGGVVACKDPFAFKGMLKGRFVFLTEGTGSFDMCDFLAREKALGLIISFPNEHRDAARYLNFVVPLDRKRRTVPCFSLSPAAAENLRDMLSENPDLVLKGRVQAVRKAGSWPLLTGSIGEGGPAVYVCGHIDEIGAQDNASGVGAAIEILRVLNSIRDSGKYAPQRRKIVFFFSTEVRGIQYWLNQQNPAPRFLGGLNLDMVGADPDKEPAVMAVQCGYRHRPHFSGDVLAEAAKLADREVGGMKTISRNNYVSDGMFGIEQLTGHTSLEQKTGKSYHTNADTPKVISNRALRWSGVAALAYLYRMSRLDNTDVMRIAADTRTASLAGIKGQSSKDASILLRRGVIKLQTLRQALQMPEIYRDWRTPQDCYKAGIRQSDGLWPETKQGLLIESWIGELKRRIKSGPDSFDARVAAEASKLVPVAEFRGFLSFEDHLTAKQVKELKAGTGLEPGWGTEAWVWMLATCCRGKQTVLEIVRDLNGLGIDVDLKSAVRLVQYLVHTGMMKLRPVITGAVLRASLKKAGVKRNSVLMVHSSLSQFGYMEGGPEMVVKVLRELLGPKGTLAMATHSNCVLGTLPYEASTSKSNTGALTEYFRRMPGVLRSAHPTHSVAAIGPAARELVEAHKADIAPLARSGFWGRLYDMNGDILLMCPIKSSTVFHVGETWLGLRQPPLIVHYIDVSGKRVVDVIPNGPWHVNHFEPTMARPLMKRGIMKKAALGESEIYFAPARAMAEISIEVNRKDPLVSLGRKGACTCFYCNELRKNAYRSTSMALAGAPSAPAIFKGRQ